MTHVLGKFVWFEQQSASLEKTAAFYKAVFGWTAEDMSSAAGRPYKVFKNQGAPVGGACEGPEPRWLSYASVKDVDSAAKKLKAAGGEVTTAPYDVPTVGRMAMVREPTGAAFALYTAASGDRDDAPVQSGDIHWNELLSSAPEKAAAFFKKTMPYGHETMAMPDGPYHVLKTDEVPRLGIGAQREGGGPSSFVQYVAVEDCDATLQKAEAAGAKRHFDPMDVPGVGRFTLLADPLGATIGIITPPTDA